MRVHEGGDIFTSCIQFPPSMFSHHPPYPYRPQKSKEDKAKADGGFAERAASAGVFSDARVLTAMDLYAAAFSDRAESEKTRAMKKEVRMGERLGVD